MALCCRCVAKGELQPCRENIKDLIQRPSWQLQNPIDLAMGCGYSFAGESHAECCLSLKHARTATNIHVNFVYISRGKPWALIIRMGLWAHYTILLIRNPQSSIGNNLGPIVARNVATKRWERARSEERGQRSWSGRGSISNDAIQK